MTAPTPSQTVGPFFGFALPFENDASAIENDASAIRVEGQVLDGAGERVGDGVDIGRHVESVKGFVVAGVDDDGQPFRIYAPDESPDELSCTHSPR